MNREERLGAMREIMMGRGLGQVAAPVRGFSGPPAGMARVPTETAITALKRALAVERQARITAEARLDALVKEIAKMRASQFKGYVPAQPMLAAAPEPETSPEVIEADEIIMPDEPAPTLRDFLTDDDEEEENDE